MEAWAATDHRPVPETKVVGHRWSARSSEVREFLARNQVAYRWYSVETPEGQRLLGVGPEAVLDAVAQLSVHVEPMGAPVEHADDVIPAARPHQPGHSEDSLTLLHHQFLPILQGLLRARAVRISPSPAS